MNGDGEVGMDCGVEEYAAVEGVLWKVDDVAVENGRWCDSREMKSVPW